MTELPFSQQFPFSRQLADAVTLIWAAGVIWVVGRGETDFLLFLEKAKFYIFQVCGKSVLQIFILFLMIVQLYEPISSSWSFEVASFV